MKPRTLIAAFLALSFFLPRVGRADHAVLNLGTEVTNNWALSAGGFSNAPAYRIYTSITESGVSISSASDGSGLFLYGNNFSTFDGYWTAMCSFYLPPAATNITLTYSNLACDDAGVMALNGSYFDSTATTASTTNGVQGQFVFADGAPSQSWHFNGPDGQVGGTLTNGFILGGQNTLLAIINNTDSGPSGSLYQGLYVGDGTTFTLNATLTYDVLPGEHPMTLALYPGIQISGLVGATYQVQYSTNVSGGNWQTLTNLVLPQTPYIYFDPTAASRQVSRFYRIIAQ